MKLFRSFPRSKIDDDILDLYFNIECLISDIDKKFSDYLDYVHLTEYYKNNPKDKKFYSLHKIYFFFRRLKEEFKDCWTIRERKKHFDFSKSNKRSAEKKEIILALTDIRNLLEKIYEKVNSLSKTDIRNNDFSDLVKTLNSLYCGVEKRDRLFNKIAEDDKKKIVEIIEKIEDEAKNNKKNHIWLKSSKSGSDGDILLFSNGISKSKLRILELIPFFEIEGLDKRDLFINEIHKDAVLPLFHYNIEYKGKNIHVIPKELKEELNKFLVRDDAA